MLIRKKRLDELEKRVGVLENTIDELWKRMDRDRLECNLPHLSKESVEGIVRQHIIPVIRDMENKK